MSERALRIALTTTTCLITAAAAAYVATNPRNASAPLHPPVARDGAGATASGATGGHTPVAAGVEVTQLPAVTSTYVS